MDFRGNEFIIIIIYSLHYAHGLSKQIHEQWTFISFSTVAFFFNKHVV